MNTRRLLQGVPVAALLLVAVGCSTLKYDIQVDRDPAMRRYTTWAWHPQGNRVTLVAPRLSNDAHQRICAAIERELAKEGMRPAPPQSAQVYVSFELGSVGRTRVTGWNEGRYDGAETDVATQTQRYRQGALVVYVSDIRLGSVVWRGLVEAVYENPEDAAERFEEVVGKLFAEYP